MQNSMLVVVVVLAGPASRLLDIARYLAREGRIQIDAAHIRPPLGRAQQEAVSTSHGTMQDNMLVVVVALVALAGLWISLYTLKAKAAARTEYVGNGN